MSETPMEKLALEFFEVCQLEFRLDEAVMRAFGATGIESDTDVESWPCSDIVYDWYDTSFELWGCKDDWAPTQAQFDAALALGFSRGWFCYADGTERYGMGPRVQKDRPRTSKHKWLEAKRRQQRAALAAALQALLVTDADCPMCDRGRLRNPLKPHCPECPFRVAEELLTALALAQGDQ